MRLLIASDLHGSLESLRFLLGQARELQPDLLVLLGDLVYHGPRNHIPYEYTPDSVIEQLNAVKDRLLCVRGNCDAEVDQMVLDFPVLADYGVMFYKDHLIYITHGHIFNKENMPKMHDGDMILAGHTHVPACDQVGECLYLNPGSVSIPKEGSAHSYMIIDDSGLSWMDLESGDCYKKIEL